MLEKFNRLSEQLKSKILFNHEMGHLTWFKAGGKAKVFIIVENENELEILINNLDGYDYFIMGGSLSYTLHWVRLCKKRNKSCNV